MHLEVIREYLEFCKDKNFTRAAKRLNMTQPGLSYHISGLEKSLGFVLVDRQNVNRLTMAGEQFFAGVQPLVNEFDNLVEKCKATENLNLFAGKLVVKKPVLNNGRVNALFKAILAGFKKDHPEVEVVFAPNSNANFIDEMLRGSFNCALTYSFGGDLSILEQYCPERVILGCEDSIEYFCIAEVPLVIGVSSTCSLATKEPLMLKDIDGYALLYDYEANCDELLYAFASHCKRYDLKPQMTARMMDFSNEFFSPFEDNEFMFSSTGYPLSEGTVCRSFKENPMQPIYVAIRLTESNSAAALFRDYLKQNTIASD